MIALSQFQVIGVAQVINKNGGQGVFTDKDEEVPYSRRFLQNPATKLCHSHIHCETLYIILVSLPALSCFLRFATICTCEIMSSSL